MFHLAVMSILYHSNLTFCKFCQFQTVLSSNVTMLRTMFTFRLKSLLSTFNNLRDMLILLWLIIPLMTSNLLVTWWELLKKFCIVELKRPMSWCTTQIWKNCKSASFKRMKTMRLLQIQTICLKTPIFCHFCHNQDIPYFN